ncbi:MAG: thioredoxin domain-containing protein [Elusimicrobia bacterium]|nr:thioredoxin domain-containing protein [Elusimicrobiota bacterium]
MNRLAGEKSPYLLQHRSNPVDWYPWGDEAFERAAREDKPVFLSIGYAACHWCHVMERESFGDPSVAEALNTRFVCVKVDREERPEVDGVYMAALHAMGRPGGWPLTMWLTPCRNPFFGATYLPPDTLKGVAASIGELWAAKKGELKASGAAVIEHLGGLAGTLSGGRAGAGSRPGAGVEAMDRAFEALSESFDERHGGFGGAPKFPQPATLGFLLSHARRTGRGRGAAMVVKTLRGMAAGGIHDHLGGGFARYSTDDEWLVPHFEKMLYDNAQLLRVCAEAHCATGEADLADLARDIAGYVLRDLRLPGGAFACGEDADSEGIEGKFYVWRPEEVAAVLGGPDAAVFCRLYDVTPEGNWEPHEKGLPRDRSILRRREGAEDPGARLGLPAAEVRRVDAEGRRRLFEARSLRVRPLRDDKVLAGWNGLMIGALAYAGRALGEPGWVRAAAKAAGFVSTRLMKGGRLLRRWRDGEARFPGVLEDYAFLADGLLDLYEATAKAGHLALSRGLARDMVELFADEGGGFFTTGRDDSEVPVRLKEMGDGALPSGNAVAARCLIRLSAFCQDPSLLALAAKTAGAFSRLLDERPESVPCLLGVLDLLHPSKGEDAARGCRGPTCRPPADAEIDLGLTEKAK